MVTLTDQDSEELCPFTENHPCPDGVNYEHNGCDNCQTYISAIEKVRRERGLCQGCGCDQKIWKEMFGSGPCCEYEKERRRR